MAWDLITDTTAGFSQWVEYPKANGWIRTAVARTTTAELDKLDGQGWAEQRAATLAAWQAIGHAYGALNLPPFADPEFRTLWARWYGRTLQRSDPARDNTRGRISGSLWIPDGRAAGEVGRRVARLWTVAGGQPLDGGHYACNLDIRCNLTSAGAVATSCLEGTDPLAGPGDCHYRGPWSGCIQDSATSARQLATLGGCAPYTWRTLAWHDPPTVGLVPGAICTIARASIPLRWQFEAASEFAAALARRGAEQVLTESKLFATVLNAREADRMGLVTNAQLRDLAARLPADIERARWTDPGIKTTAAAIASLAAVAASVPGGQVYAAILGIVAAIYSVLPAAIGTEDDLYGRAVPNFEQTSISGGMRRDQPPTQIVPDPPSSSGFLLAAQPALVIQQALERAAEPPQPERPEIIREQFYEVNPSGATSVVGSSPSRLPLYVAGAAILLTAVAAAVAAARTPKRNR